MSDWLDQHLLIHSRSEVSVTFEIPNRVVYSRGLLKSRKRLINQSKAVRPTQRYTRPGVETSYGLCLSLKGSLTGRLNKREIDRPNYWLSRPVTSPHRWRSSQIIVTMSILHTIDILVWNCLLGGGGLKVKSKTSINIYLSYENINARFKLLNYSKVRLFNGESLNDRRLYLYNKRGPNVRVSVYLNYVFILSFKLMRAVDFL